MAAAIRLEFNGGDAPRVGQTGRRWGVCPWGARSEDGGGKRGARCGGIMRPLFGRRPVRQGGAVGVGEHGQRMEEAGARAGGSLSTSERRLAGSDVCSARAAGRT
jgi:hypothetical protein